MTVIEKTDREELIGVTLYTERGFIMGVIVAVEVVCDGYQSVEVIRLDNGREMPLSNLEGF